METRIALEIDRQPDETTCGPTCLHALYRYWGHESDLIRVADEVHSLDEGGSLGAYLACHALEQGFDVTLYSYNLRLFDPTWSDLPAEELDRKLEQQAHARRGNKLHRAIAASRRMLALGGKIKLFDPLTPRLLHRLIEGDRPLIVGLCSTYLYRAPRERGTEDDDVGGEASGHFVMLAGYDRARRRFLVADPYTPNPLSSDPCYEVDYDRLIGAIYLGVLTYDANLVLATPAEGPR